MLQRLHPFAKPVNTRLSPELYSHPEYALFFTVRAYRGRPFEGSPNLCAEVIRLLGDMRHEYNCWVGPYCLMPDHLHVLAGPNAEGVSVLTFLDRFKGKTTNASWRFGWQGRLWQSRSYDHVLRRADAFSEIGQYILDNPVRAGLVDQTDTGNGPGYLTRCDAGNLLHG